MGIVKIGKKTQGKLGKKVLSYKKRQNTIDNKQLKT